MPGLSRACAEPSAGPAAATGACTIRRLVLAIASAIAAFVIGLTATSNASLAQEVCKNGVCIKFLPINNPKYVHFQLTGEYLTARHFNVRKGNFQREMRVGEKDYFPRNGYISLQQCTKCAVCTSSTCRPWAVFTAPAGAKGKDWDRRVLIINGTNTVVRAFNASNIKRKTWEEDMLGKRVLQPGQSFTANIDDGTGACLFDFRAVLSNGRNVEMRKVDVCRIRSWTIR
jgi:hypothetical protein